MKDFLRQEPTRGRRAVVGLTLAAVILCALWLRLANLGRPSFWIDEYLHVAAAQEILRSGEPILPNSRKYTRAYPYTQLVAGSFELLGVSETSARLPSALFGVVLVGVVFGIGWRWFGASAGLVAAFLVAVSPVMVSTARFARMYTLFQTLFLLALFAYQRAIENDAAAIRARMGWTLLAVVLAVASFYFHMLTFHLGVGFLCYWLGMTVVSWRSRHGLLLLATLVGVLAVDLFGWVDVIGLWHRARQVPAWQLSSHDAGYYVRWWNDAHPWMLWLLPPASIYLCMRYGRLGFLLTCQLLAPFVLQSLVLERRQVRYVSHLFPIFALVLAPFIVVCARRFSDIVRERVPRWRGFPAVPRWLIAFGLIQTGLIVMAYTLVPTIGGAVSLQEEDSVEEWRPVFEALAPHLRPGDAVVAVVPLAAAYYLDRADIRVYPLGEEPREPPSTQPWVAWQPTWPDNMAVETVHEIVDRYPRGWLIVDPLRFANDVVFPPPMRAYTLETLHPRPALSRPSVLVFSWGIGGGPAGRP